MTEANLWKWMKKANGPDTYMWRVENSVGSGSPDVEGYARGYGQFYIELKFSKEVGEDARVRTSARVSQEVWFARMNDLGARCQYILLQVAKRKFLMHGGMTSLFNRVPLNALKKFEVTDLSPSEIIELITSQKIDWS